MRKLQFFLMKPSFEIANELFFAEVIKNLEKGKSVTIPMRGVSMLPILKEGRDSVRLSSADASNLKLGDIVLFRHNNRYVLHRYKGLKEGFLFMHGDGLLGKGEKCLPSEVYAKVTQIIRYKKDSISPASVRFRLMTSLWLLIQPIILRFRLLRLFI